MDKVTKEEYLAWRDHPVTQFYLRALHLRREILKEDLANDAVSGEMVQHYIGACKALKEAVDYGLREFEYLEENESND